MSQAQQKVDPSGGSHFDRDRSSDDQMIQSDLSGSSRFDEVLEKAAPEQRSETVRTQPTESTAESVVQEEPGEIEGGSPATATTVPGRELLTIVGSTRVYVLKTDAPWTLPVDAFVLPVGTQAGLRGRLAGAFLSRLGSTLESVFRSALTEARQRRSPALISADDPLLLSLPDPITTLGIPRHVIAATAAARGEDTTASNAATAAAAVVRIATQNDLGRVTTPFLGTGDGGLSSDEVVPAVWTAVLNALPGSQISEFTFTTRNDDTIVQLGELAGQAVMHLPQRLYNDLARGPDLLSLSEAFAMADMLALRELEPPLVVGVLGGWGSGKSFVMHLIQQRLAEIRSWRVDGAQAWPRGDAQESRENQENQEKTEPYPYIGHIYPIRFDAWTYATSDLWASLMQAIFVELSWQLNLEKLLQEEIGLSPFEGGAVWKALYEMDPDVREELLNQELGREALKQLQGARFDQDLGKLWHVLRDLKERERKALQEMEKELTLLNLKLECEVAQSVWVPFENALDNVLGGVPRQLQTYSKQLEDYLKQLEKCLAPQDAAPDDEVDPSELGSPPQLERLWTGPGDFLRSARHNWRQFVPFALYLLAIVLGPWLIARLEVVRIPGFLVGTISTLLEYWRTGNKWRQVVAEKYADYQGQVSEARDRLLSGQAEGLVEVQLQDKVSALVKDVRDLEAKIEQQRQRVGLTAENVTLLDFVNTRLEEGFYADRLGMMAQVQRDLQELTDALWVREEIDNERNAKRRDIFPRGPARVFLFIDDLDRCPPKKVVEVLEAVQLLVKTPLFVVVLALDVRYITRALEKEYDDILTRRGDPSGLDYIEKIIQIPYRVRPIQPESLPQYLRAQMRVEAPPPVPGPGKERPDDGRTPTHQDNGGETPPPPPSARSLPMLSTEVVTFSLDEFGLVESCCEHINLTPRAVKRLVNVYKLLKIIWFLPNEHTQPEWDVERAVVLLLALSGRFTDLMRDVFDALEAELARKTDTLFIQFLEDYKPPRIQEVYVNQEWQRLLEKVRSVMPRDFGLRLNQLTLATFDLVRSFSFVGEIGYAPEDLMMTPEGQAPVDSQQKRVERRR